MCFVACVSFNRYFEKKRLQLSQKGQNPVSSNHLSSYCNMQIIKKMAK